MKPKKPFIRTGLIVLLIAVMVTLLCRLGFWQLSRANQKEALLQAQQNGAQQLLGQEALDNHYDTQALRYHRITLKGQFINERIILLDNIINNAVPGYYVFVPFRLNNNEIVLVNRGWIPLGQSRKTLPNPPVVKGEVTIEGYLDFAYRNPFIKHAVETDSIEWPLRMQQLDLILLQELMAKKINKMLVILDKNSAYAFEATPTPGVQMPPSRHRGYAFQWFSLAALLVILSSLTAIHFKGKA